MRKRTKAKSKTNKKGEFINEVGQVAASIDNCRCWHTSPKLAEQQIHKDSRDCSQIRIVQCQRVHKQKPESRLNPRCQCIRTLQSDRFQAWSESKRIAERDALEPLQPD